MGDGITFALDMSVMLPSTAVWKGEGAVKKLSSMTSPQHIALLR